MDNINTDLWKYGGIFLPLRLLHFFNMYWKSISIPTDWQPAKVLPLFKKGNKNSCENYRVISLSDATYKIYARILNKRSKTMMERLRTNRFQEGSFNNGRYLYAATRNRKALGIQPEEL